MWGSKRPLTDTNCAQVLPVEASIVDLISAQATAHPQALAIARISQRVSYGELESSANQLAHQLLSVGLAPEAAVGLCFGHSIDFVIAALGILKAGGAYVPLDPAYPSERLTLMLNDADADFVLTDSRHMPGLTPGPWKTISVDREARLLARYPTSPPEVRIPPRHLAYLIYTSGSTGRPKAVEISHGNLLNLVSWHLHAFDVTAADRAPFMAPLGFDAAVWEIWPYLAAGASLHLLGDEAIYTIPPLLRDWLVAQEITLAFIPTPLAEQMFKIEWPAEAALRVMLTGADTLHEYASPNLPFRLVNNYGPTECTVVSTSGAVEGTERQGILPSIGKPIDNVDVYILDENREPAPTGALGEIYIGGAGVARGYRNRPELTAERFVSNPFSPDPEARLYRTGDFGFYLEDGQIAFAGRADDQVKIGGRRVETSEIAAVLRRHPAVESAIVVAREDNTGGKYLVAYVVANLKSDLSSKALREFLRTFLPEYMVPATFVRVEQLALSSNGKIDRHALPVPDAKNTLRDEVLESPRTRLEAEVGAILAGLLGTADLGVNDNFFTIGGNSFLGIQLIGRIRDAFGVEIRLRALFQAPTIAGLSAHIAQLLASSEEAKAERVAQ